MTSTKLDEQLPEIVNIYRQNGYSIRATALKVGISRWAISRRIERARALHMLDDFEKTEWGEVKPMTIQEPIQEPIFEPPALVEEDIPIDELIERRVHDFKRKQDAYKSRKLIPVKIKESGPIGIIVFGDPHVDDDGCDWPALLRDVEIAKTTPGMMAGNVGDLQNNWVGRLSRLYGEQSTSKRQAWQLTEWLAKEVPWLFLIKGNHDMWTGIGDPLDYMKIPGQGILEEWSVRMALQLPNKREVRINCRHDFPGHSQWNLVHGVSKAAQMHYNDHILLAGHKHVSGYNIVMQQDGMLSHCIRVGGYKKYDSYAKVGGFEDHNFASSCVCIIDPDATTATGLVQIFWDVEYAADYLTFLRGKK